MSDFSLPPFVIGHVDDPDGYKPGRYWYVMYLPTHAKVSRYLRTPGSAMRKLRRYTAMHEAGDYHWPEVTRCDELLDSPDAVPTLGERFAARVERPFGPLRLGILLACINAAGF